MSQGIKYMSDLDALLGQSVRTLEAQMQYCPTCKDWGPTVQSDIQTTIQCPDCKRETWPNLGVNCPAGSAWALSSTTTVMRQRAIERSKPPSEEGG